MRAAPEPLADGGQGVKVSKAQAADNRDRILQNASRLFRAKGFDGTGIAELMQAAGLTNGAFYGHFTSKDDLMAQVCSGEAGGPWRMLETDSSPAALTRFVRAYLEPGHAHNRADGCLTAALAGDAARQIGPVRRSFTRTVLVQLERLARAMPGPRARQREQALSAFAALVGALILARAVDDPDLAHDLFEATIQDLRLRGRA